MAQRTGCDVVPVAIHGGHRIIPKHGRMLATHASLWVEVLSPVAVDRANEVESLSDRTREVIRAALAADPNEPEHAGAHA